MRSPSAAPTRLVYRYETEAIRTIFSFCRFRAQTVHIFFYPLFYFPTFLLSFFFTIDFLFSFLLVHIRAIHVPNVQNRKSKAPFDDPSLRFFYTWLDLAMSRPEIGGFLFQLYSVDKPVSYFTRNMIIVVINRVFYLYNIELITMCNYSPL